FIARCFWTYRADLCERATGSSYCALDDAVNRLYKGCCGSNMVLCRDEQTRRAHTCLLPADNPDKPCELNEPLKPEAPLSSLDQPVEPAKCVLVISREILTRLTQKVRVRPRRKESIERAAVEFVQPTGNLKPLLGVVLNPVPDAQTTV